MEHSDDVYQYQGAAFQFIGFDELTQFRESDYRYLFSRLRKPTVSNVPLRMRSATNPGGRGHDWVKRRFITSPRGDVAFVPAKLADNRHVDQDSYLASMANLDPATREQLLAGNWDAGEDAILLYEWILAAESIEQPPPVRRPERYVGVDVGRSKDRTCIWSLDRIGDVLWTSQLTVLQNTPFAEQAAAISKTVNDPSVVRVQIDKGYNPQLAEDMERRFPGKVIGVQMTAGRMGQFASQLANQFEGKKIRIPADDEDLRGDLRLVSRVDIRGGQPVVATARDSTGHADRFWAAALAVDAALWSHRRPTFSRPVGIPAGR